MVILIPRGTVRRLPIFFLYQIQTNQNYALTYALVWGVIEILITVFIVMPGGYPPNTQRYDSYVFFQEQNFILFIIRF